MKTYFASDILREIAEREISLVPSFDGRFWTASVDRKGTTLTTRGRKVEMISATSTTPAAAVRALIEKLDAEAKPQSLYEPDYEGAPF